MSFNRKVVARITGLSQRQIGQWERSRIIKPSLEPAGRGNRRIFSFVDLVLLRAASLLMGAGLSSQKATAIIGHLRKHVPDMQKPAAGMQFITDGDGIFVLTTDGRSILDTLARGRTVVVLPLGKIIEELKCEVDDVCRERPNAVVVRKKAYDVVLYPDTESGGYCVACPSLPGCDSQGDTEEEALEMIKDAIKGHLAVAAMKERSGRQRR